MPDYPRNILALRKLARERGVDVSGISGRGAANAIIGQLRAREQQTGDRGGNGNAFNPLDSDDIRNLRQAMRFSRRQLGAPRGFRRKRIMEFVGRNYAEEGSERRTPVPFLALAVNLYRRQLAPRTPKSFVTSKHQELLPIAKRIQLGLNHLLQHEIRYKQTKRMLVLDALFLMGIAKVGLTKSGTVEIDGYMHDVGKGYVDRIDLDDWLQDMSAKRWESLAYMGHRYRASYSAVMGDREMKNKDGLQPTHRLSVDDDGEERLEALSRGDNRTDADEYRQYVELWELWLPEDNLIVTLPVEESSKVLKIQEWEGPEFGPYHILQFGGVPDQLLPLAPSALWVELHTFANSIFRKLQNQATRQKKVLGYTGNAEDAERIKTVNDGDGFRLDDPQGAKELSLGGIDQVNLAMFIQTRDLFSWFAGNLDTMGGLSPQAETLGQEEILRESSGRMLEDMLDLTLDFDHDIIRDSAWYMWEDPLVEMALQQPVKGSDRTITVNFTPEDREGNFIDFNIDIDPYAVQYQSPAARLNTLNKFIQQLAPFIPMMEAQGITLDFEGWLREAARYADMPELERIIRFANPQQMEAGPVAASGRPAVTERRNIRINKPGRTRSGVDTALTQSLLGKGIQASEAEAAVRAG